MSAESTNLGESSAREHGGNPGKDRTGADATRRQPRTDAHGSLMRALAALKYGSLEALELSEVERPVPRDDEVLIRVHAASLNKADLLVLKGMGRFMGFGLLKPAKRIPGADVAGRVEEVGARVTKFRPGDDVFGDLSGSHWGAFAEYVCASEVALAAKPANLSFPQAAAVPMAAVTALQALRDKGGIQPGQSVLINGASGGVGTFAVQIAKSFGARVAAVCSTRNVETARSVGADHVIDYTKEDFTRSGRRYDLILAANGNHSIADYKRALNDDGICVVTGGSGSQISQAMLRKTRRSKPAGKRITAMTAKPNAGDLLVVAELAEGGKLTPVIDSHYPLEKAADALRYLGEGHARGKVVIAVCDEASE